MAQFILRLKDEGSEARIAEYLREQVNQNEYLKQLIRAEMNNRSYTDLLIRRIREELLHSGELELENEELRKRISEGGNGNDEL